MPFSGADLIDAPLMPAAFERRLDPQHQDFVCEAEGDDTSAHRQNVGVVVLARQPSRVEVVTQGGAHAGHFVRRDLLSLTAAADDDAAIGTAEGDLARDADTDRRVVDRFFVVSAVIVDVVAEPLQRVFYVFLEEKAGVIGADGDAHKAAIVL